jgi:hypothetical protein
LAQLVHSYLDKIDDLQQQIIDDSELILDAINMDELLQNPEGYLVGLGEAFLNEHLGEIKEGVKEGEKFAKKVLSKS